MATTRYQLFETALGRCAIAWRGDAVVATALPGASDGTLRRVILRRQPEAREDEAMPPAIAEAARGIAALLAGEARDLAEIRVDLPDATELERRVYAVARTIRPGETLTYGAVAGRIGGAGDARAVGAALGRNPVPIIVPCHRVVAAAGRTGGFSAPGGVATKMRLLTVEARHAAAAGLFDGLPLAAKPGARVDRGEYPP